MNHKIYPLAYKLSPKQTCTLYYLGFPTSWKAVLLNIARKTNPKFKDEYGLPTNALKKLVGLGLLEGSKRGKEVFFRTTDDGRAACERYRQVREACLIPGVGGSAEENARLGELAALLRSLSGRYDQAARAAAAARFDGGTP